MDCRCSNCRYPIRKGYGGRISVKISYKFSYLAELAQKSLTSENIRSNITNRLVLETELSQKELTRLAREHLRWRIDFAEKAKFKCQSCLDEKTSWPSSEELTVWRWLESNSRGKS